MLESSYEHLARWPPASEDKQMSPRKQSLLGNSLCTDPFLSLMHTEKPSEHCQASRSCTFRLAGLEDAGLLQASRQQDKVELLRLTTRWSCMEGQPLTLKLTPTQQNPEL